MSSNTSYGRVTGGFQGDNYSLRSAIDPTSTTRDLRQFVAPRRQRAAAIQGNTRAAGIAGLNGENIDAIIQSARGPQKQRQPEQQGIREHAKATLDALTDQAAGQASEPAVRYGTLGNDGKPVMSTRDTRDSKTVAATGEPLDDIGPLGSFGEPTFGRAAGWAGGVFGGF